LFASYSLQFITFGDLIIFNISNRAALAKLLFYVKITNGNLPLEFAANLLNFIFDARRNMI